MLYNESLKSLNIVNCVYKYDSQNPNNWNNYGNFLIESAYFKEVIDLIIEYQLEFKRL